MSRANERLVLNIVFSNLGALSGRPNLLNSDCYVADCPKNIKSTCVSCNLIATQVGEKQLSNH